MQTSQDVQFMHEALIEAQRGLGFTSPNPMVGALIVKDGIELSRGYHAFDGQAHAETVAIAHAPAGSTKGATLYVTLEPCCHYGRTPPCTKAVIEAGISRVVIASTDPDPRVAGQGIAELRGAGIEVTTGVLTAEAERLNSIYFHFRRRQRPYIVLKAAVTLDGKLATGAGDSRWISSPGARQVAHALRRRLRAIAIGSRTLETDHPRLTCRLPGWEQKPVDKIVFSHRDTSTLDTTGLFSGPGRVMVINGDDFKEPVDFLKFCTDAGIDSVLVEGGGGLHTWFLRHRLVDRIFLFYRPAFLGNDGIPMVRPLGKKSVDELEDFSLAGVRAVDGNVLVDLYRGEALCLLDS